MITTREDTADWKWYFWPNRFNQEQCLDIGNFISNNFIGIEDSELGARGNDGLPKKKISSVKNISYGQIKHLINPLVDDAFYYANNKFGYLTNGPHDMEWLNFNTYSSDSKDTYDWHVDESNNSQEDIKLTLLMNLSTEPYTGGEFQTWVHDEQTHLGFSTPGSAIMFKSHLPHRVLPVTSGTRKSLTMFITGPRFR